MRFYDLPFEFVLSIVRPAEELVPSRIEIYIYRSRGENLANIT